MCMNCGCGMVDDDMNDERNTTLTKVAQGAVANNQDGKTTLENMKESLEQITPQQMDQKIEELKRQERSA